MIKKLVIYGVIGVVGWHAIKNTKAVTWIRTEVAGIRKSVEENTSPEKDLARAVQLDWKKINDHRSANLERWNKEVLAKG